MNDYGLLTKQGLPNVNWNLNGDKGEWEEESEYYKSRVWGRSGQKDFFLNLLLNHPFRVHMLNPLSMYSTASKAFKHVQCHVIVKMRHAVSVSVTQVPVSVK